MNIIGKKIIEVFGAGSSAVNGVYYPDATFMEFARWKHATRDIWLRAGSGLDWSIVDCPTGLIPDGKIQKTRYYASEDIEDEDSNLRNPWEVDWYIDESGQRPLPQFRISNEVAY